MRHSLWSLVFALALVPAHSVAGQAGPPYVRIYAAPHYLSTGVSVTVKAQVSNTSNFASWWWGSQVWFNTSNANVVSVSDAGWNASTGVVGTLTAVGAGTATITVTDESGTTSTDVIQVSGSGTTTTAPVAQLRIQCANGAWCDQASGRTVSVSSTSPQQLYVVALDASGNVLWMAPAK